MIAYEGSWDRYIPLVEFVYNNSFQLSIRMALYEALYGRKCTTPLCWTELSEKKVIGSDLIQETKEKVKMITERLKVVADRQKSYVDLKREDIQYEIGKKVFWKVSPCKKIMRFGRKGKLSLFSPRICHARRIPIILDWLIRTEVRGARLSIYYLLYYTGTLIDLFFIKAVLVPIVYKQFL